ncbi:MAG: GGDEF domain-containing protein [Deltaproteobacteria bacterium]|nr:GGDEF domain-containing protein [Deltaproteobacteria bacterium]
MLEQLGVLLRETVRRQDVVARWGGEEFVIVARDAEDEIGAALANRVRHKVASHPFRLHSGETIKLTCSIGYSVYPFVPASPRALAWDDVLALADAGLYRAKQEGRNRAIGIVSGETAASRDTVDEVKNDFDRARESGLVRLVG